MNSLFKKVFRLLLCSAMLVLCFSVTASAASTTTEVKALSKGSSYSVTGYYKVKPGKTSIATAKKESPKNYKITGLKTGKTTLKCYDKKGNLQNKIYLIVTNKSSFQYDTSKLTLVPNQTKKVQAAVQSGCTVKYSSSKPSVAKVNSNGKITAKKKGTTKISAKVYYKGTKIKTLKKTVKVINCSYDTTAITLMDGYTKTVAASVPSGYTVKYSSSNKKVATVNSKGKITAEKAGTATIYAKIYSGETLITTYKKTVTVPKAFNVSDAKANLEVRSYRISNGVIAIIKNNYAYDVDLDINCNFYDSSGTLIEKSTDWNFLLESGNTCAQFMYGPFNSSGYVNYSYYEVSLSPSKPSFKKSDVSKISCSSNYGNENVMVTVKNTGNTNDSTIISIVFYKDGVPVGYDYRYANVANKGDTDYIQFNFPYDVNNGYKTIVPTSYEIYVNSSFHY